MALNNVLQLNKALLGPHLTNCRVAVDATVGNGYDSEFILNNSPLLEQLYCCDIQKEALILTQRRLMSHPLHDKVIYIQQDHRVFFQNFTSEIDLALFNLGYLPGGDHKIMTEAVNTVKTLDFAGKILRKGGIISIVSYPGTPNGMVEHRAILEWASQLPQRDWEVLYSEMLNQIHYPPCLFLIEKR